MTVNGRQPIKFGGVILDANQIKTKKVEKGLKNDVYVVEFKNGVKARYEMQNSAQENAALNSTENPYNNMTANKVMNTEGWNIRGLTIEGSNVKDNMVFHDCDETIVNNFNDNIKDNCYFDGGKNNKHFDI